MSRRPSPESREDKTFVEAKPAGSTPAQNAGPAPADESVPDRIGVYKILDEIGRGGMGRVYKAVQTDLGRTVALKTLPLPHNLPADLRSELIERFAREVSLTSRLRHPSIIPVFDFGQVGELRFFTMPYIEGEPLSALVARKGRLSARAAFELVLPIAQALAHAHARGVIHRDIKPSNILVDGESRPILLDFGLVKCSTGPTDLTTAGMILGTPQYMSPEQASGYPEQVDEQSDVYSLGAVLFFMLTGRPPFDGRTTIDVLTRIANQPVPDPTEFSPELEPAARDICLKALSKDKPGRYGAASHFGRDVARFLKGRPVKASRPRERKPGTRPPWAIGVAGIALLSIGLSLASWVAPVRPGRAAPLVVGVAPFETRERIDRCYAALAGRLARDLEQPVDYRVAASYDDLLDRITRGKIDLAVLSAYNYVRASETADLHVLATFTAEGRSHYQGAIVTRRDAGIDGLPGLEGRSFGYVDRNSASGYLFPRALLLFDGLAPDEFLGPSRFFGSHSRLREAVLAGEVEAGATYLQSDLDPALDVIARTEPIPFDAFVTRPGIDEETRSRILDVLLAIAPDDPTGKSIAGLYTGFDGWRTGSDTDYDYVRQLIRLRSERVRIAVLARQAAHAEAAERLRRRLGRSGRCILSSEAEVSRRLDDRRILEDLHVHRIPTVLGEAELEYLILVGNEGVVLFRRDRERAVSVRTLEIASLESGRIDETAAALLAAIPAFGIVLAVDPEGVVRVNLGATAGLAVGDELQVFHHRVHTDPLTGQVLRSEVADGRLEVVSLESDQAVCRIVSGEPAIGYGKRVRTRGIDSR